MQVEICVSSEMIPDLISWRIMSVLKFAGSHIFIVFKGRMYHAVERGVCDDDFTEFCKTHHITFRKNVEFKCTVEEFFRWYESYKGTDYSESQYVGFLFKWLRPLVRNKRKGAVCSEFVAWAMADLAGRKDFEDADFLTPKEVFERI